MPHKVEDEWSDSDDEDPADVETSVLLGVSDGPLADAADLADAAVSRIGGHPAFLTREPDADAATCKNCGNKMELLVQVWCPLEDSPMDRGLYVWACARSGCQRKEGSVRAWRNLRRNVGYAAKLEKKKKREDARRVAEEAKIKAAQPVPSKGNPFALSGATTAPNPFGLGSQIFGAEPPAPPSLPEPATPTEPSAEAVGESAGDSEDDAEADEADEDELVTALATTTLTDSPWLSAPAYAALYLSTCAEYIPPPPKEKRKLAVDDDDTTDTKSGGGFAPEGYENSLETDHVFDRFSARVASEPEQCLRYELGGTPLPYGSDAVFERLWPAPKSNVTVIGKDLSTSAAPKRTYDASAVPACTRCGAARVFECQLMPNLINVVAAREEKYASEEARVAAVRASLDKGGAGRGMEWGTCLVFSCERDCCEGAELFGEEVVLVQWDE